MESIKEILQNSYTKIKQIYIKLHKEINDCDVLIVNQYKSIYIFDRNDIVYINDRNDYISFQKTNKTDFYEKYLKLDHWGNTNAVYPYLISKNIEDMQEEQCVEIKLKNKFLYEAKTQKNLSYILKLEKENDKYYICYYVKNIIFENIKNGKKEYIINQILEDTEKENLLTEKNKELEELMIRSKITVDETLKESNNILKKFINLYEYQKNDIIWMKNIEDKIKNKDNTISFEYSLVQNIMNDAFVIINGTILPSSLIKKQNNITNYFSFFGGNLISEVGLGKTIITLYHIFDDELFNKKREKYNKFIEFGNNCNYFYKRGKNKGYSCDKECTKNSLYCNEHYDTLFLDKRELIYKNLHHFNPKDFISSINNKINTNSTLIICPNHLSDQWVREYYEKFENNKRIVLLITKDQFNNLKLSDILFSDVVITSYNVLISKWYLDLNKKNTYDDLMTKFILNESLPLEKTEIVKLFLEKTQFNNFSLFNWHRIVLDEAHEIQKTPKNFIIKDMIIRELSSDFKWNITATPFSNGLNGFLELMNYNTSFKKSDNYNLSSLYSILTSQLKSDIICKAEYLFKRNTKKSIENEIKKNIINQDIKLLDFTSEERAIYNSYEHANKNKFSEFLIKLCCHCDLNEDTKLMITKCKSLEEIKQALLKFNKTEIDKLESVKMDLEDKLRELERNLQILEEQNDENSYIELIKNNIISQKRQITNIKKSIDTHLRTYNYLKISIESLEKETCSICLEIIQENEQTITKCGHKFCYECITSLFNLNRKKSNKCPNCNTLLNVDDLYLYSNKQENKCNNLELQDIIQEVRSTKIGNILYFLKDILKNNEIEKNKIIIFSQWDTLLEKVEKYLTKYNFKVAECKGSVYQKKRAINNFINKNDINIIMLSSRNAASGTNLTIANKIILLEPVYGSKEYRINIENQAIGRSDRIGQNRPIDIYKFIIKDTIEEDIINNNITENDIPNITFS